MTDENVIKYLEVTISVRDAKPEHEKNVLFLEYWNSIKRGQTIPQKSALDPIDIPYLLPNVILFEIFSPDRVVVRVCGTAIVNRIRIDPTGMDPFEYIKGAMADAFRRTLRDVYTLPCGYLTRNLLRMPSDLWFKSEFIHLPLAHTDGTVRYVFTSAYVLGTPLLTHQLPRQDQHFEKVERHKLLLD